MQKWMVEFLKKNVNTDIKIARVNSILITKSINLQLFTLILYGVGIRYDRRRFLVLRRFIEKSKTIHMRKKKQLQSSTTITMIENYRADH